MTPLIPRYGERSLADLMPAVLGALGATTHPEVPGISVPESPAIAVLLVDGLGSHLLRDFAAGAPFLSSLPDLGPLTVGFPSSTSISLATLGTGVPSGTHGIVGIAMRADDGTMLDTLRWAQHGVPAHVDLRDILVPEAIQATGTIWELASALGIRTTTIGPRMFQRSGLTRVALRGGTYRGTLAMGDVAAEVRTALAGPGRRLCYAYHADLDLLGHAYGPGSDQWRMQLQLVDRLAEMIAGSLPPDGQLLVTGDHGMVAVDDRIDADVTLELQEGVEGLGGDPRSRHVYTRPGARDDVLAIWRETLGARAWVRSREEAIDAGWFGSLAPAVRPRIGDVVAAMMGTAAVIRSEAEPMLSRLVGQHGSLTEAEQLVPLVLARSG